MLQNLDSLYQSLSVAIPDVDNYIMTPKLLDNSGIVGCLALARDVKEKS
ncbi:hypothetical protein EfmAA242_19330 [Enterococcus faecium]|nr:hypothetical protein EfmAA242_19330 [Enterococcus faecium]